MTDNQSRSNKGYRWILTSIEVLSRYVFTEPSKTKSGVDVADVRFGKYPDVVQYMMMVMSLKTSM